MIPPRAGHCSGGLPALSSAALFALLLVILPPAPAAAEVILTTVEGQQFRGILLPQSDAAAPERARLLLPDGITLTLERSAIRSIEEQTDEAVLLRRLEAVPQPYALALIDEALQRAPSDAVQQAARVHWLRAADSALQNGQTASARSWYRKVLARFPGEARAAAGLDHSEAMLSKLQREADGLLRHLEEHPDNDLARFDLGRLYQRLGQADLAFAEYRKIVEGRIPFDGGPERINELRELIRCSIVETEPGAQAAPAQQPSSDPAAPWVEMKAEDLLVRCHAGAPAERVAASARAGRSSAILALKDALPEGFELPPLQITLYATEQEFRRATGERGAPASCRSPASIFLYEQTPRLLQSALPHEVMHLVLHHAAGKLPLWLEEGLAVRQESVADLHFARLKQLAASDDTLPLRTVVAETPAELAARSAVQRDAFYAAAFVTVEFLIAKGGARQLIEFAHAAERDGLEPALKNHYGYGSFAEFERAWSAFAQ